jgi:hypothetical protein
MPTRSTCGTSQVCRSHPNIAALTDHHTRSLSRRLAKRPRDRHPSSNSHPSATSANRKSRSHSPSYQKPQKRRNTMNSRDAAAYDEMMALIVERSAVEAAAAHVTQSSPSPVNGSVNGQAEFDEAPSPAAAKKKRKRGSEDAFVSPILCCLYASHSSAIYRASIKRTRSASTTSDRPAVSKPPQEETPAPTPKSISMPAPPVPPPKSSASRNRRGGGGRSRPSAQAQDAASVEGEEGELALSVSSQIGFTHFGNRRRWRCSRPEQPTLWRWSLSDHWLSAQPKLGRSSHTAHQWIRGICLSPTSFFLPVVFVITTTATATANIVGSARLPCPFGANSAEQDATTIAVTWLWRGTWCASSVAWETHERR